MLYITNPHLGLSDHISLLCLPVNSQLIKNVKPSEKLSTCGQMSHRTVLSTQTDKSVDDLVITETVRSFPNQ